MSEKNRLRAAAWYAANKERVNAYARAKYAANPDKFKARAQMYRQTNPDKVRQTLKDYAHRNREKILAYKRLRTYGLTTEQFNQLKAHQKSLCAICTQPFAQGYRTRPHVDHNHQTGKVRGLLCSSCNCGLGYFQDNSALLEKAKIYLKAHE